MARRSIAREAEMVRQRLGHRPIVLVGLMGAGKTSVGRRLAENTVLKAAAAYEAATPWQEKRPPIE